MTTNTKNGLQNVFRKGFLAVAVAAVPFVSFPNAVYAADTSPSPAVLQAATVPTQQDGASADDAELPERGETLQAVLLEVCTSRGYDEQCAKNLLGMVYKETSGNGNAIGDHGRARGWFQIHYRLHNISVECAEDLRCSANWTISYLEKNGYPRYVAYAIQCHNSCNVRNGYAYSAMRKGNYFWGRDLPRVYVPSISVAVVPDDSENGDGSTLVAWDTSMTDPRPIVNGSTDKELQF